MTAFPLFMDDVEEPLVADPPPITFFVGGTPAPQGSKSAYVDKRTGRAVVVDGSSTSGKRAHRAWRKAVAEIAAEIAAEEPESPFDEPLSFAGVFIMESPKSDQYRTRHTTKPDIDKLMRSVFDSLTESGLIADDSRFFSIDVQALYARPGDSTGVYITIGRHGPSEAIDRALLKSEARQRRTARA